MRKHRSIKVILVVLGTAWVLTATISCWVHTPQTNTNGRVLARHEWPESVVELLRDTEQRYIKIDHLKVYLGQHDNYFWRCDATPGLLDFMVTRWELHLYDSHSHHHPVRQEWHQFNDEAISRFGEANIRHLEAPDR